MNETTLIKTLNADHGGNPFTDWPAPAFEPAAIDRRRWRNGLVVRMPNHLGDAVMALPALVSLRQLVEPPLGLFVIAPAVQEPLYRALGCVDYFVGLAKPHRIWQKEERRALHRLDAGAGVLFNNSLRDAIQMRLAGVKLLYGAAARGRACLLAHAFPLAKPQKGHYQSVHQSNYFSAMAQALGAPAWDGSLPPLALPATTDDQPPLLAALLAHPKLLAVAPGAAYGAAKRWPAAEFREVTRRWIASGGIAVILGAPSEIGIAAEVAETLPEKKVYNLSGNTSLSELMAILKSARAVLCNDSGIMHLAAALGTPGVAVFGPTDYTATGPIGGRWHLLYRHSCEAAPCFRRVCPRGNAVCMQAVTADDAASALLEMVRK